MATWFDLVALIVTVSLFGVAIFAAFFIGKTINSVTESTKESLKTKGLHVTESGLSVKTNARMDRERYIDKTQAALIDSMKYTSFGNPDKPKRSESQDSITPGNASSPEKAEKRKTRSTTLFSRKSKQVDS